jgi:hypothetical protein
MGISFKEKSIWTSLIMTIIIFGYYFTRVFNLLNQPTTDHTNLITLFIGVVILMITLEITIHIIISIFDNKGTKETGDERDRLIDLKATKISYYILILGVFQAVAGLLMTKSPIMIANIILLFFVFAEIVGDSIRLYYYRKGI